MAEMMQNVTDQSVNATTDAGDVMASTWLRVLFVSLYCVVFALGVSGNSLVVYVICRDKSLQTTTNVFIANLAVSDIVMCLLAVPFTPISGLLSDWVFGKVLCHVVPMIMGVSVYVSTLTSMAIAVDRYFAIVHPLKSRLTSRGCLIVIAAVWAASVGVTLPLAIHQNLVVEEFNGSVVRTCTEDWLHPDARRLFTVGSLVLQYLVPGAIIVVCYWCVSVALRRRARNKRSMMGGGGDSLRSATTASRRREQQEILRNRRTNRMLIAMVAIFIVCWLPLNVINLLLEYREQQFGTWRYILLVFFVAHVVAMSSTVYNPFLYAWMNDAFRREFQRVLPVCGFIGGTSQPDDANVQSVAATIAATKAVKGGGVATTLATFYDNCGAGGIKNADVVDDVEPQ